MSRLWEKLAYGITRRGVLERRGSNGALYASWRPQGCVFPCPVGGLFHRIRGSIVPNSVGRTSSWSESFHDLTGRGSRKHGIRAPLWYRTSHSAGARLPAHQQNVAISRAEACRTLYRDLRGPARLWP